MRDPGTGVLVAALLYLGAAACGYGDDVDGRIVAGQNQNAGAEVANSMMKVAGGTTT